MRQNIKVFGNLFIKEIVHRLVYGCTRGENQENAQWTDFVEAMSAYYKPTENITMNHFHFQSNTQKDGEMLITFCNHVLLEENIGILNVQQKTLQYETKSSLD